MTKKFTYTFKRANGETVILKKTVTDRMEERNDHKKMYAAAYFNEVLKEKYGFYKSEVSAKNIKEG